MALTLCEHACKTVCDVKSRIDPCPSPARSRDKAYQISGCTAARKNFRCCEKMLSRSWNSFKFAFLGKQYLGLGALEMKDKYDEK